jgi:hypothetical protein
METVYLETTFISYLIALVCERLGYRMPFICTPEELMGV